MVTKSKLKVRNTRELKHLVAMSGLTTKGLAESVDVTPSYASSVINGKAYPSPTTAMKITDVLSVRLRRNIMVNDIFFDVGVKKKCNNENKFSRGGELMKKEYKETLEQQLQLLSESSNTASPDELVALTDCMIRVHQELSVDNYQAILNQQN